MLGFEELNNLETETKTKSIPYDKYFGEMDLTDEQKEERKKLAKEMEMALLFLFFLIKSYKEYADNGTLNKPLQEYTETMIEDFKYKYKNILIESVELTSYLDEYVDDFTQSVTDVTLKHIDDDYFTSEDRATFIAENEANVVLNAMDYERAIKQGKTRKKWIDMQDNRERKSHLLVGGKELPIKQPFVVGDSLMMFPKDNSMGAKPKEIIGCRCSCKYF
jgi:hypothetical protein